MCSWAFASNGVGGVWQGKTWEVRRSHAEGPPERVCNWGQQNKKVTFLHTKLLKNNEPTPKQFVHHKPGNRGGRPSQTTKEMQGTNEIDEPGLFIVIAQPMEAVGMENI